MLGRKAKPRTTYARYYRNKRSSHVYDICDVPLSPQRKSQHSRLGTSISKHQDPRPTEDNHTTPSGSQKHTVKSSLTATPPVRRPLPDSADGRASPRSITHRIPVEPTNDPALQMPAASSNKILTQLGNKLSRKPTAPWKKTREAAKVETPKQAKSLPPNTNHLATEVSNEVVPNEHTRAGAAVSDLNLGYSGSTEMARVDSESDPVRAKLSQTQTEDNDEYFNVEAITSCKIGTRVRCFRCS